MEGGRLNRARHCRKGTATRSQDCITMAVVVNALPALQCLIPQSGALPVDHPACECYRTASGLKFQHTTIKLQILCLKVLSHRIRCVARRDVRRASHWMHGAVQYSAGWWRIRGKRVTTLPSHQ